MEKRNWLVTGCSTGFGRALAQLLLDRGENVVVTARRPETIAGLVAGREAHTLALALDVTNEASIAAAAAAAIERFGTIDVLVNNAGFGDMGTVEETPVEVARAMMETNYFGALAMIRQFVPAMRARRAGHIVNIGSVAADGVRRSHSGFPGTERAAPPTRPSGKLRTGSGGQSWRRSSPTCRAGGASDPRVVDAAARVGGIKANSDFQVEFLLENLKIQNNLIECAHQFNTRKLLFLGSSCIYPKFAPQPITESSLLTGVLEPTNDA